MMSRDLPAANDLEEPATSDSWGNTIRLVTAGALVLALAVIVFRTLSERSTDPAEAYLGGLFFAVVATGIALAIYIGTGQDD